MTRTELLAAHVSLPPKEFCRGIWDCCSWVADWARTISGRPVGEGITCRRLSTEQAKQILKDRGGMTEAIEQEMARNGWDRLGPNEPRQDGDICTIRGHNKEKAFYVSVGIFRAGKVIVVAETGAFRLVPPEFIERAYRWA